MKSYSVVRYAGGECRVEAQFDDNLDGAIVKFHNYCAALRNDPATVDATVKILDEKLDLVDGYLEWIRHTDGDPIQQEENQNNESE